MPDPTAPATADELAALYLRGRDVACPICNYNRRGGSTATCPECGAVARCDFLMMPAVRLHRRTARRLAWLLIAAAGLSASMMVFSVLWAVRVNGWGALRAVPASVTIFESLDLVAQLAACGMGVAFLLHLRSRPDSERVSTRKLTVGLSLTLAAQVIMILFQFYLFLF